MPSQGDREPAPVKPTGGDEEVKPSFYEQINNDAVRITFLVIAILASNLSLLNSWLIYSLLKYWFLIADY